MKSDNADKISKKIAWLMLIAAFALWYGLIGLVNHEDVALAAGAVVLSILLFSGLIIWAFGLMADGIKEAIKKKNDDSDL